MYITHNKYQFEIRLYAKNGPIYISNKINDIYVLCVPINISDGELRMYIPLHAKDLVNTFEKNHQNKHSEDIYIYAQKFNYVFKPNLSVSYRSNNAIYSTNPIKSPRGLKKVKHEILLSDIKKLVGIWEERLNCIIDDIYLKNYKTKSFQICRNRKVIGFSYHLIEYHFSYIEFMVAKAVFIYLALTPETHEKLMKQFVNDWKQSTKVFEHERSTRN